MQELFTRAVAGVIKQGRPSMGPNGCAYRGCDGTKCAVGFLIDDEYFDQDWNHEGVYDDPRVTEALMQSNPNHHFGSQTQNMLGQLQSAHDNFGDAPPDFFQNMFRRGAQRIAQEFGLEMPNV